MTREPTSGASRQHSTPAAKDAAEVAIADRHSWWRVVSGDMVVRLVGPDGVRHRLLVVQEGGAVLGISPADLPTGWSVQARVSTGTAIRHGSSVGGWLFGPGLTAATVDGWLTALLSEIGTPATEEFASVPAGVRSGAAETYLDLRPGQSWSLPGLSMVTATGPGSTVGPSALELPPDTAVLLPAGSAGRATAEVRLLIRPVPRWIADLEQIGGLRAAHRLLLAAMVSGLAKRADAHQRWWAGRPVRDAELLDRTWQDILTQPRLLGRDAPEPVTEPIDRWAGHAVAAALAAHGAFELTDGEPMVRPGGGGGETAQVVDLLERSGARATPVRLTDRWFAGLAVPLLGTRSDGSVVALLPARGGAVEVGADGNRVRVTAESAGGVDADAWQIHRPLPPWRPALLVRFVLHGLRADLAGLAGCALAASAVAATVPLLAGWLLGRALAGAGGWRVGLVVAITLAVAQACLLAGRNLGLARLQGRVQSTLEPAVWSHLLRLDTRTLTAMPAAELLQRANGVSEIRSLLGDAAAGAVLSMVGAAVGLTVLFLISGAVAVSVLIAVVIIMAILARLAVRQQHHESEVHEGFGRSNGVLFGLLSGIDKIHVSGREIPAFARWARVFSAQKRSDSAALRVQAVSAAITAATLPVLLACALAAMHAPTGGLPPAGFMVVTMAISQVVLAAGDLVRAAVGAFGVLPAAERLRPLLQAAPEVGPTAVHPGRLSGAVAVENVTFGYLDGAPPILTGIDLHADPGEMIAVVGPSGSGKSTLIRMLIGLDIPSEGAVRYDRRNLQELDVAAVRTQLGVVLQNGRLLRGSILENVRGACTAATTADIWRVLKLVGMDDAVARMPMGLHTVVGDGAGALSGGQQQRLLLARALLRTPSVLLLDEATSALDNTTQRLVIEQLAGLRLTRIVVAHRLSTIRGADRIYVLDGGRVVGVGGFDELMETCPVFARLVRRQEI